MGSVPSELLDRAREGVEAAEKIDQAHSGGDIIVQACAEDPMVALHAIHNMTRIAFVRDPQTNFVPVLKRMYDDQLTECIQHIASSMFIIPPGLADGDDYIGQKLFEG